MRALLRTPFKIVQGPGTTAILYESGTRFRQVLTDGRPLPEVIDWPAWQGFSIGRWDRDTFVITTSGFNGKAWLDQAGHPESDAMTITERFRRRDFGHMDMEMIIDDRKMYTRPWSINAEFILQTDTELLEFICEENERDSAAALPVKGSSGWLAPRGILADRGWRGITMKSLTVAVALLDTGPRRRRAGGARRSRASGATPRTPWGEPDLQGTYSNRTITPFERPANVNGREFFTKEEVAALEARAQQSGGDDGRSQGERAGRRACLQRLLVGSRHEGHDAAHVAGGGAGGRAVPAQTEAAKATGGGRREAARVPRRGRVGTRHRHLARSQHVRAVHHPRHARRDVADRLQQQLPHHAEPRVRRHRDRDARRHARHPHGRPVARPSSIRQWMGHSVGRWEGDTLVVDTTNFTDKVLYRGAAENLHLVERFTRVGPGEIDYRVTIEDPTTFSKPWTLAIPFVNTGEDMFEYACHEGNYGMEGILSGARQRRRRRPSHELVLALPRRSPRPSRSSRRPRWRIIRSRRNSIPTSPWS